MTTSSYPVVGANIDHAQWRTLFAEAPGYFDPDEQGMSLTLSSTDDTATITTGKHRFRGFVIRVTAAHGLTLAAASGSAVTYSVGIMYDPAKEADPAGPLYLAAPVKTGIGSATPSGGSFLTMYEVTRQPSQVLSQAAVADKRRWAMTPIYRYGEPVPPAADFKYGQVLIQNNPNGTALIDVLVRRGGTGTEVWQSVNTPSWAALSLAAGIVATGSTVAQYGRGAGQIHLSGLLGRSGGALFAADTEYTVTTLSQALWPHQPRRFYIDSGFGGAGSGARCFISAAGVVTVRAPYDTDVISLDGVSWHPKGL